METSRRARERWKILAKVVTKNPFFDSEVEDTVSVRRFIGFGLFKTLETEVSEENYPHFQIYACCVEGLFSPRVWIRKKKRNVCIKDLIGFNNTGNICIWPSEEVLSYYLLKHKTEFEGKHVCELGAGMTALAGVMLAASCSVSEVCLTDGNHESVTNIEAIVQKNESLFGITNVHSRTLIWDDKTDLEDLKARFDVIIAGDCLFNVESHKGLLHVMDSLLTHKGYVILMSPRRAHTLQQFCATASSRFEVQIVRDYDELISTQHEKAKSLGVEAYDEDIHYPLLVLLQRPAQPCIDWKKDAAT